MSSALEGVYQQQKRSQISQFKESQTGVDQSQAALGNDPRRRGHLEAGLRVMNQHSSMASMQNRNGYGIKYPTRGEIETFQNQRKWSLPA